MGNLTDDLTAGRAPGVQQPGPLPGSTLAIAATATTAVLAGVLTLPPLGAALVGVPLVGVGTAAVVVGDRWSRRRPPPLAPLRHRPPSETFHLALVGPTLVLLLTTSVPTGDFLTWLVAWLALGAGAVVWAARVGCYLVARVRRTAQGTPLWLLVAPVAGTAVLALVALDAPLRARWMASRPAFEAAVASGELDEGRNGWFEIEAVSREGDAVTFREAHTGMFTTGGFLYLPDGPPSPDPLDEWSEYRHLGGPWYAWTSGG